MASYTHDAKSVIATHIAMQVAALITQSLLNWLLLPTGRGEYGACLLFVTMLVLFFALGQEVANIYFLGSSRITVSEAVSQSILVGIATSLIACGLGYAMTTSDIPLIQTFFSKAPIELYRISLLYVPAIIFQMYFSEMFLGLGDVRWYNRLVAAPRFIALPAIVLAAMIHLDVMTVILIDTAAHVISTLLAGVVLYHRYHARWVWPKLDPLVKSLSYGARFYVGKFASMVNVNMGLIMLMFSSIPTEQLGLFSAATAITNRLWLVAESMQRAMLPRITVDPEGRPDLVAQCTRLCLAGTAVVVLVVAILSKPIILIFLSPPYLPVWIPFLLLLPGVVVRVIPKILTAYFNGQGHPGIVSMVVGIAVVVNVLLMIALLPRWDLNGVSISISISYAIEALILGGVFVRLSGKPIRSLVWLQRADWKRALAAIRKPVA